MIVTEIDRFYDSHKAVSDYLLENGELSFANDVGSNFRRSLVLAIASFFEHEITAIIRELPRRYAAGNPIISELIERKAISRQYHQYFAWDTSNANSFFSLFGSEFREAMQSKIRADQSIDRSVKAFLELGALRNRLVHQNFVQFDVDKSVDDIMTLYRSAQEFLALVRVGLLGDSL